jgi:uncharacterized protein
MPAIQKKSPAQKKSPQPSRVNTRKNPSLDPAALSQPVEIRHSPVHGWGLYALAKIPRNRKVIEYLGEWVSRREAKKRWLNNKIHCLFEVDSYWCRDGAVNGSGAEYMNHSCEPNVAARIIRRRIYYYSTRDIRKGEELFIDYRFDSDVEKVICKCGAKTCRGTINLLK